MKSFLQSPEWQDIQERNGRPTLRVNSALVIRHDLPFRLHYLYCPRPELISPEFIDEVHVLARQEKPLFLRIDPGEPLALFGRHTYSARSLQPAATVRIDCRLAPAELLGAMHPKTRYNVRLAERRGVSARPVLAEEGAEIFECVWEVLSETARREGFTLHPKDHYRTLLAVRSDSFANELWVAETRGEIAAAAIINWFSPSSTATYLHGGSARGQRALMAPHLLHWAVIAAARSRGFGVYDFGGVDPQRWPGLTRFKQSFGGSTVRFPPSVDSVFRPASYAFYRAQQILRH